MTEQTQEPEVVEGVVEDDIDEGSGGTDEGAGTVDPALAVAIREERSTAVQPATILPSAREWEATLAVARQIAATPFVPESYRNNPESVVAAILTGRELGIGPMQSLRDIHMIDGRPAFSAQLMLAKMRNGGVIVVESNLNQDRAWIKARRTDTGEECEVEFTWDDAETAGLTGKKNWKTYRKDMLWARAVGRLARRLGSDLLGGLVYSKEEVEDFGDGDYGVGEGYDASSVPEFDPARQLLPSAIRGAGYAEKLAGVQKGLADDLDWTAMLMEAATAAIGPREEWTDDQKVEFRIRWANAIARTLIMAQGSPAYVPEFGLRGGTEGDQVIVDAIEFAFGHTLAIPLPRAEASATRGSGPEPAESVESAQEANEGHGEGLKGTPDDDIPFPDAADDS